MKQIKDIFSGIKKGIKLMLNFEIFYLMYISMFLGFAITILIGGFTGNIGLIYMSEEQAISSIWFLIITHFIATTIIFIIPISIIILKGGKK